MTAALVTGRPVGRWPAVMLLLAGLLIVAHGCHADRDTELRVRPVIRQAR